MDNKQIDEAIKHLQKSLKKRADTILFWEMDTKELLELAHKYENEHTNSKYWWQSYHHSKKLRNFYVNQQIVEKNLLKLLYSLQNGNKVIVSLAPANFKNTTKH